MDVKPSEIHEPSRVAEDKSPRHSETLDIKILKRKLDAFGTSKLPL